MSYHNRDQDGFHILFSPEISCAHPDQREFYKKVALCNRLSETPKKSSDTAEKSCDFSFRFFHISRLPKPDGEAVSPPGSLHDTN